MRLYFITLLGSFNTINTNQNIHNINNIETNLIEEIMKFIIVEQGLLVGAEILELYLVLNVENNKFYKQNLNQTRVQLNQVLIFLICENS